MTVTSYYGKLRSLWDSLVVHEPPFACKCGKCDCGIGPAAIKRLDNERLHQIFMGLDPSLYGHIRSQQFQQDPLPTLNRAYNIVLQEERLRTTTATPDVTEVAAFHMSSPGSNVDWRVLRDKEHGERHQKLCSHCNTRGHDISTYFFKTLKFPDWWGDRPRTLAEYRRSRSRGGGSGSGFSGSGNIGASGTGSGSATGTIQANAVTAGVSTHNLLASDRLSGMSNWIIDTGASNHVTGSLSCLEDREHIAGRPGGLPNGQQVVSNLMGSVYINDSTILTHVLYVPSLKCNLLSVSQLLSTNAFRFEFDKNSCIIQDHSSRTTIGAGELRDGLYRICSGERPLTVNTVSETGEFNLWHRRLGYPSDKVVFGCLRFAHNKKTKGDKFAKRGRKCLFVGYPSNKKGWKLYDLDTKSYFVSRDVVFYESVFPLASPSTSVPVSDHSLDTLEDLHDDTTNESVHDMVLQPHVHSEPTIEPPSATASTGDPSVEPTGIAAGSGTATNDQVEELGRGRRIKIPISRLRGYVLGTANCNTPYL
ncbi:uncharacterized protein LOC141594670 [Silene latifolia]|uniref:uncharacterized protein LOC141594670 n=1 Tax=Silene latifolia TaxID=37657 RepID=UPI003D76BE85